MMYMYIDNYSHNKYILCVYIYVYIYIYMVFAVSIYGIHCILVMQMIEDVVLFFTAVVCIYIYLALYCMHIIIFWYIHILDAYKNKHDIYTTPIYKSLFSSS